MSGKFHFFRMTGKWWCSSPYNPSKLECAVLGFGDTKEEAYSMLMEKMGCVAFTPPPSSPRTMQLNRQWEEAEQRQRYGMHRPWSSLDCAVRNGK